MVREDNVTSVFGERNDEIGQIGKTFKYIIRINILEL